MSSLPICQVCHRQFSLKGPASFLLPCVHAVCETCVTSAAGGVISCSSCHRDVNLTERHLKKDEVRVKQILHLTVKHHPELVLCTNEEDGNQAVCWCKECDEFLCEHCQMVHNSFKVCKKHITYDVGEIDHGSLVKDKYCSVHPKFMIDTWDKDCSMLTCGKCRFGDHAGHELVEYEKSAETARREIATFGKEIRCTDDQHKAHISAIETDLQSSHERGSILDGKISFVFNSLKVLLDQREKELKVELQTQESNVRDQLNAKKNTSETCHQNCRTIFDYINNTLDYSSPYDILELRQLLEEKSQDCRSSAPPEDYKSPPLPVFNTDGLDRIKSTLAHFGTIATEAKVPTNQMQDNWTQTVEDVMQELSRLTQEVRQLQSSQETLTREKNTAQKESVDNVWRLKQKLKQLNECHERLIREQQEIETLSGLYRLPTQTFQESLILNCTEVKFSKKRYNAKKVHINAEVELINKSQPNTPHSYQRLKKYVGTSSTVPLLQCGSPQYFEVNSRVVIEKALTDNILLLEIGLAREDEQDQSHWIGTQPNSYSLTVAHCKTLNSICGQVWRNKNSITCLPDTLENTPGTSVTLHYGVVYDSARRRIAFLDVKNKKIIGKIDNVVGFVSLRAMFGVHNPHRATVGMSLVVGIDIDMTENKKGLILESLS